MLWFFFSLDVQEGEFWLDGVQYSITIFTCIMMPGFANIQSCWTKGYHSLPYRLILVCVHVCPKSKDCFAFFVINHIWSRKMEASDSA
jgi:hypothetical protein